jgi:DNA-binding MurR/RpiR family transcriptional regulator
LENVLLRIRESFSDFSLLDRKIATYILESKNKTIQLSIRDIAEHCDTSQAAIVRFCKLLGLAGFKELKHHLTSDMLSSQSEQQGHLLFSDITDTKDIRSIAETIVSNHTRSMIETQRLINYADLEQAVNLIAAAPRVDFYGVGASGLVALDAQQKFLRIGKICNAHSDPHVQITMAANLSPGDVAVAISYSGATKDLLETVSAAKQSGARVIAITRYGQGNRLSALADITLYTASSEMLFRSGSTSSRIAQLTMIDVLFIGMASLSPDENNPKLERTYNLASKRKARE